MNLPPAPKEWIFVSVAIILICFGTINIAVLSYAQEAKPMQETDSFVEKIAFTVIERLLLEIGPIVGGAVIIAINFARKKGLVISAEAEEYFVKSASSFVVNQGRFLYKTIRDNPGVSG